MICLICNAEFEKRISLCNHLSRKHNLSKKDYYDFYIKIYTEGICKYDNCTNQTKFLDIEHGYKECCCLEHTNLFRYSVKSNLNLEETKSKAKLNSHTKEAKEKQKQTNLIKYGSIAPIGNKDIKDKIEQTNLSKYGVKNVWQSEQIKQKSKDTKLVKYNDVNYNNREKFKQTCLEKYNVEHPLYVDSIKEKQKATCKERYNSEYYFGSNDFKNKSKQTCLSKYGIEYIFQSEYFKDKIKKLYLDKYNVDNPSKVDDIIKQRELTRINNIKKFEQDNNYISISKIINKYGQGWLTIKNELNLIHYGKYTFIQNDELYKIENYYSNHTRSKQEDKLYEYIKSIYSGIIIRDTRSIIKPYELDFYFPELNLAIEYNGMYYHSTNIGYDKYAHLNKTKLCLSKNIILIHIFEYEWLNNTDICKSIISATLNKYNFIIDSKNCEIKLVNSIDSKLFLKNNSLQDNYIDSTYNLGLYYNSELVQLMCISKLNNNKNEVILERFCTKLFTKVINGFNKLLEFQSNIELISYIDINKQLYKYDTNYEVIDIIEPSCSYYKQNNKLNNSNILNSQELMQQGWLQVYDCGLLKVKYKKENYYDKEENI